MNRSALERKAEALAHYDRMIVWAESQPPNDCASSDTMRSELGEAWFASYCIYCQEFMHGMYVCVNCPLNSDNGCCGGKWYAMDSTKTWEEWVYYAKRVRSYIKKHG